jgi:hypothetical protein
LVSILSRQRFQAGPRNSAIADVVLPLDLRIVTVRRDAGGAHRHRYDLRSALTAPLSPIPARGAAPTHPFVAGGQDTLGGDFPQIILTVPSVSTHLMEPWHVHVLRVRIGCRGVVVRNLIS